MMPRDLYEQFGGAVRCPITQQITAYSPYGKEGKRLFCDHCMRPHLADEMTVVSYEEAVAEDAIPGPEGAPTFLVRTSQNTVYIEGAILGTCPTDSIILLTVRSKVMHKGFYYVKDHKVRVLKDDSQYLSAEISRRGDTVRIEGTIHRDNSIVSFKLVNDDLYRDGRFLLLRKNLPAPERFMNSAK